MGIGIGLLIGLIAILSFNHIGGWLGRQHAASRPAGQFAAKEAAPKIIEAAPPAPQIQAQPAAKSEPQSEAPQQTPVPASAARVLPTQASPTQAPPAPASLDQSPAMADAMNMSEITEPESGQQLANLPDEIRSPPVGKAAMPAIRMPVTSGSKPNEQPAWLRNSVAMRTPVNGPMIAIVLDDVGVVRSHAELAIDLPAPITLSMMTYAEGVADLAAQARAKGHELMLHVPMQPVNPKADPGPHALLVGLSPAELKTRLDWGLGRFPGFIGINNHMGSRFTQDEAGMRIVMQELQARGLLFLDSKTIANSVGDKLAQELGVAHVDRDVFLDDDMSPAAVARQLAVAERVARKQGYVIAIGHPHPATVTVLKQWLTDVRQRGFTLVPLSVIARRENGVAG